MIETDLGLMIPFVFCKPFQIGIAGFVAMCPAGKAHVHGRVLTAAAWRGGNSSFSCRVHGLAEHGDLVPQLKSNVTPRSPSLAYCLVSALRGRPETFAGFKGPAPK